MPPLTALHRTSLPPSGTSHALSCQLAPQGDFIPASSPRETRIGHLVTARTSKVQVWEVVERKEAEGKTTARLSHLLTRQLPGTVTSLSRVRTLASRVDGCDRVLVGFLDAKMSLMEYDPNAHDLVPVSLHTFEKLPQVVRPLSLLPSLPSSSSRPFLPPSIPPSPVPPAPHPMPD
ncbi:hypothetical protein JCM10213_000365 [Rhodosporidiobolus nylandii]